MCMGVCIVVYGQRWNIECREKSKFTLILRSNKALYLQAILEERRTYNKHFINPVDPGLPKVAEANQIYIVGLSIICRIDKVTG